MSIAIDIINSAAYNIRMNKQCCTTKDLKSTADILRTVSEASRLKIICMLKTGERCVCELQEEIDAPHNLVLHHLNSLKKLGIINSRKENRFTYYSLDEKLWDQFTKEIEFLFKIQKGGKKHEKSPICLHS